LDLGEASQNSRIPILLLLHFQIPSWPRLAMAVAMDLSHPGLQSSSQMRTL
jgi:hypothetical protein